MFADSNQPKLARGASNFSFTHFHHIRRSLIGHFTPFILYEVRFPCCKPMCNLYLCIFGWRPRPSRVRPRVVIQSSFPFLSVMESLRGRCPSECHVAAYQPQGLFQDLSVCGAAGTSSYRFPLPMKMGRHKKTFQVFLSSSFKRA